MRLIRIASLVATMAATVALTLTGLEQRAEACGCLSPPVPDSIDDEAFAVNQQAEQIIFEVEEGFVTAHVLIQYAGAPEQFAWLVPVPSVPELSLSPAEVFGLLDQATAPDISVATQDICPSEEYFCRYHPYPSGCVYPDAGIGFGDAAPVPSPPGEDGEPPVELIDRQIIGSYDTVTFGAGDAQAAVDWLNQEGFVVNDTMVPFMQPYADEGKLFVASKLIPGADVSEIKPLRMRYAADKPVIPLKLTAVAAEPNLTVTTYVYGGDSYRPEGLPLVDLDQTWLSRDSEGRLNYPMVLARAIDEAGGDGFVIEYSQSTPTIDDIFRSQPCCDGSFDFCFISNDQQCQCPNASFDQADCEAEAPALLEGADLLDELAEKHAWVTRITTRLSAEEMTFDPAFVPVPGGSDGPGSRLSLRGSVKSLSACENDIIDSAEYSAMQDRQDCASMYCDTGVCAMTDRGAACLCDAGSVARVFTDLDGQPSITCVPDRPPVDLGAGGIEIPDVCAGIDCGQGTCVPVGGFPTCRCDDGAAASFGNVPGIASCRAVSYQYGNSGARDFSGELDEVKVCAPAPPASCGSRGWLEKRDTVARKGEECASSVPPPERLIPPDPPTCTDVGLGEPPGSGGGDGDEGSVGGGCTCDASGQSSGVPLGGLLVLALGMLWLRRRRAA